MGGCFWTCDLFVAEGLAGRGWAITKTLLGGLCMMPRLQKSRCGGRRDQSISVVALQVSNIEVPAIRQGANQISLPAERKPRGRSDWLGLDQRYPTIFHAAPCQVHRHSGNTRRSASACSNSSSTYIHLDQTTCLEPTHTRRHVPALPYLASPPPSGRLLGRPQWPPALFSGSIHNLDGSPLETAPSTS